jgi:hypothetical protein
MESLYEKLSCTCGCQDFLKHYGLSWKDKSGTVESNAGYSCQRCKRMFVSEAAIREVKLRMKEREMEELRAETASLAEQPAPVLPLKTGQMVPERAPVGASAKSG